MITDAKRERPISVAHAFPEFSEAERLAAFMDGFYSDISSSIP
jgi:hypothetical protein